MSLPSSSTGRIDFALDVIASAKTPASGPNRFVNCYRHSRVRGNDEQVRTLICALLSDSVTTNPQSRHPRAGGDPGLHRDMTLKSLDPRLRGDDGWVRLCRNRVDGMAIDLFAPTFPCRLIQAVRLASATCVPPRPSFPRTRESSVFRANCVKVTGCSASPK